jgi:5-dehydro-4-deoxyglucarate dehydratase
MAAQPEHLKTNIGSGLLSFPVTHFTDDGALDSENYRYHVAHLLNHGPAALFAAGGTGEFFSLSLDEYERVIESAVETAAGRTPVIAGVGYGAALATEFARRAERAGADGILLLPPYLVQVEQEGLFRHVAALCRAVGIGVIVYHRDNSLFEVDTMRRLCDAHPNLIGFKDGLGDVDQLTRLVSVLGDRVVYIGGMPTAEIYASANRGIGLATYSSAIFNFVPEFAQRFYSAVQGADREFIGRALRNFFVPFVALRNRRRGYAVSIVKAGLRVVGRPAGPVRAPLVDLTEEEHARLAELIVRTKEQ